MMWKLALIPVLFLVLVSCTEFDYYLHSATGHLQIISKRKSISDLLKDEKTPATLQQRLQLISEIRDFASRELSLPENDSYRSYVQLDRPYVVWNVVATPEFSLEPLQWCFPIVGCVNYRGYFDREKAQDFAQSMDPEHFDTAIVGVPAYSTLNWFNDPVLSTFSNWPETSIAKLLFHELAHQKLYVPDDTVFNESFATAVEQIGIDLWLNKQHDPELLKSYQVYNRRQEQFHKLLQKTRSELQALYSDEDLPDEQKRDLKQQIFVNMRGDYEQLKEQWNGYAGYDSWFSQVNNARFASIDAYRRWVPAFKLAYQQEGRNMSDFYRRCAAIAALPEQQRNELLETLTTQYQAQTDGAGEL